MGIKKVNPIPLTITSSHNCIYCNVLLTTDEVKSSLNFDFFHKTFDKYKTMLLVDKQDF